MTNPLAPPPSFDASTAAAVRVLLQAIQMPEAPDGLGDLLHGQFSRRIRKPILRQRLERDDLDVRTALIITFNEQLPFPAKTLAPEVIDLLLGCGLLAEVPGDAGSLRSPLLVSRIADSFIVADPIGAEAATVMPPGPGTVRLARLLPSDLKGRRMLDLCAGPGSVALVAAARGAKVVAVDLSERCVAFMRANAALNAVHLDIRLGDLFEPVAGERFDVVATHPPYVELPEALAPVLYLHGGERGDELPYRVMAGMPDLLEPAGEALVEFHAAGTGDEVNERVEAIFEGSDCEVALFTVSIGDADTRAINTGGLHDPDLGPRFDEAVMSYRRHLDEIGLEGVAALAFIRRRRAEWTRQPWKTHTVGRDVPHTRRVLDHRVNTFDIIASTSADDVFDMTVRAPEGSQLLMEIALDGETPTAYGVRVPMGSALSSWELTPHSASLLQRLCEAATVRDAMIAFAEAAERERDAELEREVVEFVMHSLLSGVLYVAPAPAPSS